MVRAEPERARTYAYIQQAGYVFKLPKQSKVNPTRLKLQLFVTTVIHASPTREYRGHITDQNQREILETETSIQSAPTRANLAPIALSRNTRG